MKIGVTGGIGSGKSFVVAELERLGAAAYRADTRAKELVYLPHIKSQIISLLGGESYTNNLYNTKYISNLVFSNDKKLSDLNAIIHPEVFRDFAIFCDAHPEQTIVYESALMIETGHTHLFDKIILVTAPIELRIERVMKRDHIDRMTVEKRIAKQWTDDKKRLYADFIVENIDKSNTIKYVVELWKSNFQ